MTGTKNLSQMIRNRKFIVVLVIFFLVYLLPEIFFPYSMAYISGGVVGGTIAKCLEFFDDNQSDYLSLGIWVLILIALVFLFYRIQIKPLKYFIILLIAFLLYVIDFIFFMILLFFEMLLSFEMFPNGFSYYLDDGIRILLILLKSLFLTWIYYKGNRH